MPDPDKGPFQLRWGIIGAGYISGAFVKDIVLDPKTRNVHDVTHTIAAVAARDKDRAQEFIDKYSPGAKAYGSYEEIVADPTVDAIYIGTPHSHHYQHTKLALTAHKHVLCEKPFTCNAAELQALIDLAKLNNVFLMEALWTRFLPISQEIKKINDSGELGDIRVVHADLSGDFDIANKPKTHRILDPYLAGGGLLDLGPYPLIWAMMCLYEHPKNKAEFPDQLAGTMLKTPLTDVDASCTFSLTFSTLHAQAQLSTSIELSSPNPAVTIRYRKGNILIPPPSYAPKEYIVQWLDKEGSKNIAKEEKRSVTWEGGGWHFQADEVARCIRDGKIQSDIWSLEKSVVMMKIFDEVRKQGGYVLPEGVEQVV